MLPARNKQKLLTIALFGVLGLGLAERFMGATLTVKELSSSYNSSNQAPHPQPPMAEAAHSELRAETVKASPQPTPTNYVEVTFNKVGDKGECALVKIGEGTNNKSNTLYCDPNGPLKRDSEGRFCANCFSSDPARAGLVVAGLDGLSSWPKLLEMINAKVNAASAKPRESMPEDKSLETADDPLSDCSQSQSEALDKAQCLEKNLKYVDSPEGKKWLRDRLKKTQKDKKPPTKTAITDRELAQVINDGLNGKGELASKLNVSKIANDLKALLAKAKTKDEADAITKLAGDLKDRLESLKRSYDDKVYISDVKGQLARVEVQGESRALALERIAEIKEKKESLLREAQALDLEYREQLTACRQERNRAGIRSQMSRFSDFDDTYSSCANQLAELENRRETFRSDAFVEMSNLLLGTYSDLSQYANANQLAGNRPYPPELAQYENWNSSTFGAGGAFARSRNAGFSPFDRGDLWSADRSLRARGGGRGGRGGSGLPIPYNRSGFPGAPGIDPWINGGGVRGRGMMNNPGWPPMSYCGRRC